MKYFIVLLGIVLMMCGCVEEKHIQVSDKPPSDLVKKTDLCSINSDNYWYDCSSYTNWTDMRVYYCKLETSCIHNGFSRAYYKSVPMLVPGGR
jgi:hypothetical protein